MKNISRSILYLMDTLLLGVFVRYSVNFLKIFVFLTYQFLFLTLSGKCVLSTLCRACKKESVSYAPILNYENNGHNFNNNGIFNVLLSNTQSLSSNLFGIVLSFWIVFFNSLGAWSIITISLSLTRRIVCFYFFQSDLVNFF